MRKLLGGEVGQILMEVCKDNNEGERWLIGKIGTIIEVKVVNELI